MPNVTAPVTDATTTRTTDDRAPALVQLIAVYVANGLEPADAERMAEIARRTLLMVVRDIVAETDGAADGDGDEAGQYTSEYVAGFGDATDRVTFALTGYTPDQA